MNVMPEWNTADDLGTTVIESGDSATAAVAEQAEAPASREVGGFAPEPGHADAAGDPMAGIAASVRELADSAERYHARAEQRENVIEHLRTEVERLRRGERRGLLRPLLAEICRLRNDLLRQAGELPEDFDTERAALLLRSYAESVELALENSGVVTFAPDRGDNFDPRMHRRIGAEPTGVPAYTGRIAQVRRDGYLDVDANSPIAPAEVVVFAAIAPESSQDKREEQ
jgi:molecular chaperone GrpE (heat shock protein)